MLANIPNNIPINVPISNIKHEISYILVHENPAPVGILPVIDIPPQPPRNVIVATTPSLIETTKNNLITSVPSKLKEIRELFTINSNLSDFATTITSSLQPPINGTEPYIGTKSNLVSGNITSLPTQLCGRPGFCSSNIYTKCSNLTLSECQECDNGLAAVFMFFIVCLGIAILLGNLLIVLVGYQKHKENKDDKMVICKTSLAVADMVAGVLLLTLVVYNFSWSIHSTPYQITEYSLASRTSGWSFFGGTLLLFGFTSSVYHLLLMSLLRLLAVTFPLKYKFLKVQTIGWCLVVVWIISSVTATVPGWFPGQLFFVYQVSLMLFYPAIKSFNETSIALGLTMFFYLVPYLLMTLCAISTAIVIRRYQIRKRNIQTNLSKSISKEEISIFTTMIIMQAAFTLAMIPVVVVVALFYSQMLNCSNVTIPYIVSIYFSMTNSFCNVFIYNFREKNFRSTAKKILCFRAFKGSLDVSKEKGSGNQHLPTSKPTESTEAAKNSASK